MIAAQMLLKYKAYHAARIIGKVTSRICVPIVMVILIFLLRILFDFAQVPQLLEHVFEDMRQILPIVHNVRTIVINLWTCGSLYL